jgi:hypothetical protein
MTTLRAHAGRRLAVLPLLLLAAASLLGLTLARPAHAADPVSNAISALRSNPVYVDPNAEGKDVVDVSQVENAVSGSDVVVAVLPASAGEPATLPAQIGRALGGGHSVIVLTGKNIHAGSNQLPAGRADQLAKQAFGDHSGNFSKDNVTGAIVELTGMLKSAEAAGPSGGGSSSSSDSSSDGGSGSGAVVALVVIAAIVIGGLGFISVRRRRRRQQEFANAKAEVRGYYERLGNDVLTLDPKGDEVTGQALADAAERYSSAGSAIANATTVEQLRLARQTAIEGLYAARVARQRLGLDPGPDLPTLGGAPGTSLDSSQQVQFGDKQYEGHPDYRPGAPYYYGGGTIGGSWVPGGWYSTPFWEPFLLGAVLSGGFGGGWGGGGYGAGYDQGFERGYDEAQKDDPGGDWGGGGGDWGGGGGDWGGGGGGDGGGGW